MLKSALTIAVFAIIGTSSAFADECDTGNLNTFDAVYCQNKVFVAEDARLNSLYGDLRGQLSSSDQNTLKDAQLNWIDNRNNECVGQSDEWGDVVYANCAVKVTRERDDFLAARITECSTVGCASSKLSDY